MTKDLIFLSLLGILALCDSRRFIVPNIIVLPAILFGGLITHQYAWAMIMFLLTSLLYIRNFWRGGDVKLFAMIGAFLGVKAVPVLALTIIALYIFRRLRNYRYALPVTPFAFFISIPFAIEATRWTCLWKQ